MYLMLKVPMFCMCRVNNTDDCNRDKCPKMVGLCPDGGTCLGNFFRDTVLLAR